MQGKTVRFALFVTALQLFNIAALPQDAQRSAELKERRSMLQACLRDYIDQATPFEVAWTDLNSDRIEEAILYLQGEWCGSGGCTTLVVKQAKPCFELVTKITLTRPPIRVLDRKSNGWRSLGVWVEGGGIGSGYEAELTFDGQSYPNNPTEVPRSASSPKGATGQVLISKPVRGSKPVK